MNDAERMIIAKLQDRDVCSLAHNSCHNDWVCEEAAGLIERQQAQNEELKAAMSLASCIADEVRDLLEGVHDADAACRCLDRMETAFAPLADTEKPE